MRLLIALLALIIFPLFDAQTQEQILSDSNGDGTISIAAFGDSITYGTGDNTPLNGFFETVPHQNSSAGYPTRLSALLGVPVRNSGLPGEELVASGFIRFIAVINASQADLFLLMEGANDAVKQIDRGEYARSLQKVINVAKASGRNLILLTPIPPCCTHSALAPFTDSYADVVRDLAFINELSLVDTARAWNNTCPDLDSCPLYNRPEGLHPNTLGYDALSQTVAATLLGIDIFSPTGASDLENSLGLPAGTVIVKPDPIS